MDYVAGESLGAARPRREGAGERVPVPVAVAVMSGVLHGLHAAHEARDERGRAARDRAPRRVSAEHPRRRRTASRACSTSASPRRRCGSRRRATGSSRASSSYMAPEQLRNERGHAPGRRLRRVRRALGDAHRRAPLRGRERGGPRHRGAHGQGAAAEPRRGRRGRRSPTTTRCTRSSGSTPWSCAGSIADPAKRFESAREMADGARGEPSRPRRRRRSASGSSASRARCWPSGRRASAPSRATGPSRSLRPRRAVAAAEAPTQASSISVAKNAPRAEPGTEVVARWSCSSPAPRSPCSA